MSLEQIPSRNQMEKGFKPVSNALKECLAQRVTILL